MGGTILVKGKTPSGETSLLRIQKTDITRGSRIIGESGGKINLMKNKAPETELLVKENAKAFFYDGGVFGGSMTASGKNALITANKVTINEGTVIKAENEGHITLNFQPLSDRYSIHSVPDGGSIEWPAVDRKSVV